MKKDGEHRYPRQHEYYLRKRAKRMAAAPARIAQFVGHNTCAACGSAFPVAFTLDGRPRQRKSKYCSELCYSRAYYGWKPNKERACRRCGKVYVPKCHDNSFYCSKHCGQRDWERRNPEKKTTARNAPKLALLARRKRLLRILRRILRAKQKAEVLVLVQCAECHEWKPLQASRITKYCSDPCRKAGAATQLRSARRSGRARSRPSKESKQRSKRVQKKRSVDQLRASYVKDKIARMAGIRRPDIPKFLIEAKRQQLLLYRSIVETKDAIHKGRQASDTGAHDGDNGKAGDQR